MCSGYSLAAPRAGLWGQAAAGHSGGSRPTLMPGTAAFSTRKVTRMNPLRLSPPGSNMMGSRFLQGGQQQLSPCPRLPPSPDAASWRGAECCCCLPGVGEIFGGAAVCSHPSTQHQDGPQLPHPCKIFPVAEPSAPRAKGSGHGAKGSNRLCSGSEGS